jgi:hypothetical protein
MQLFVHLSFLFVTFKQLLNYQIFWILRRNLHWPSSNMYKEVTHSIIKRLGFSMIMVLSLEITAVNYLDNIQSNAIIYALNVCHLKRTVTLSLNTKRIIITPSTSLYIINSWQLYVIYTINYLQLFPLSNLLIVSSFYGITVTCFLFPVVPCLLISDLLQSL